MKKIIFLFVLVCSFHSFGQRTADKTVNFDESINDFFFHEVSGVPMVLTNKSVNGVDPLSGQVIWSVEASSLKGVLNALGQDVEIYKSVPLTPLGIVGNTLFDTRSGKILLSEENNNFTKILDSQILLETGELLVATKNKETKKISTHLVDVKGNQLKWSKELEATSGSSIKNLLSVDNRVVFSIKKNLFILDEATGEIIAGIKEDIGEVYVDDVAGHLIAVENKGGSLLGSIVKTSLNPFKQEPLGKKVMAFDLKSGQSVWKKPIKLDEGYLWSKTVDGKLLIKHEKGANIYDYATGVKQWKNDYGKKSIKDVEKTDEGYMVYYGSKRILLNDSGKKIWKKPQRVRKDVEFDVDDEEDFSDIEYNKGFVALTASRIAYYEIGQKKAVWKLGIDEKTKIAFDEKRNNIVVLNGKKLYVLNPDSGLGKDQGQKLDLKKQEDFNVLEIRGNGYFISSPWEYVYADFKGNVIKQAYYKQPGEGLRTLQNIGSIAVGTAGAYAQVAGLANATSGATIGGATYFVSGPTAAQGHFDKANKGVRQNQAGRAATELSNYMYNPDRFNAFKQDKNSAFYFTKNSESKYLVQVDKDSGDEKDKFIFYSNKPKYEVDKIEKRVFYIKGKDLFIYDYK